MNEDIFKLIFSLLKSIIWVVLFGFVVYNYIQGIDPDNFIVMVLILMAIPSEKDV